MFSKLTAVFAILAAAAVSAQTVNTPPSLTQCVPTSLSWTVTNGPFYLSIIPGGQPSAAPLLDFGQVTSSPQTWNVNITAGTSIGLKLVDAAGLPYYSEAVTILPGTSDSCLDAAAAGGSSSAAASGSSSSAASSSTAGGVAGAASSVAASASDVVSSVRASASNVVSSATDAANSAVNSATNRATSATSAAAAASSTAGNGASKIESTGLLAAALAIVAVAAL